MLWALCDPRPDGLLTVDYPYFERPGGVPFVESSTYVDHAEPLSSPESVQFNHGLAEIVNALWDAGLKLDAFEEHRSIPWNAFGDAMVALPGGEFELREQPDRLAASYTLQATRPG
jgi:hypothetical protein